MEYLTREYVEGLLFKYGFTVSNKIEDYKVYYKKGNFLIRYKNGFLTFYYSNRGVGSNSQFSELEYLKKFLFHSTLSHTERIFLVRNILDRDRTYDFLDYKLYNLEKHIKEKNRIHQ